MNNCKFTNNTVSNAYIGIALIGFAAVSPFTLYDQNNQIGTDGGNTVTNFGGGSSPAYGIYAGISKQISKFPIIMLMADQEI